MEWVELPHGRVRAVVEGPAPGPTVLMIHGLSYPLEAWGPVSNLLVEAGFRTIRCDLYGRGHSGWDETPLTSSVLADQQRALLDHFGVRDPVRVISLSNADLIALWFARECPDRVIGLAFVGPSGFDARTMNTTTRWMGNVLFRRSMARWMRHRLLRRMDHHSAHMPDTAPPDCGVAYAASIDAARRNPPFGAAVVSHLASLPTKAELLETLQVVAESGVSVGALHFGAEEDATPDGAKVLSENLVGLQSHTLGDCGHMGMLETPQHVAAWWLEFSQNGGAAQSSSNMVSASSRTSGCSDTSL